MSTTPLSIPIRKEAAFLADSAGDVQKENCRRTTTGSTVASAFYWAPGADGLAALPRIRLPSHLDSPPRDQGVGGGQKSAHSCFPSQVRPSPWDTMGRRADSYGYNFKNEVAQF
ncbi:hypothetical protein CMUS01_05616 [Colletotrichum musicola]|uniref:Uncharacterized protein n=1 Tax=Colletotrichum musicola TaxID=2175873 RepID=A0A8H6KQJ2_9PEZI|nr:hypothetical protein CMUS01_05616 [Colletotrichum musicola]